MDSEGQWEVLLEIAVDFETVVSRVSHHHVAIRGEGQSLRPVERVSRSVDVGKKRAAPVKHLKRETVTCSIKTISFLKFNMEHVKREFMIVYIHKYSND